MLESSSAESGSKSSAASPDQTVQNAEEGAVWKKKTIIIVK
jgi:hypothetical protein